MNEKKVASRTLSEVKTKQNPKQYLSCMILHVRKVYEIHKWSYICIGVNFAIFTNLWTAKKDNYKL